MWSIRRVGLLLAAVVTIAASSGCGCITKPIHEAVLRKDLPWVQGLIEDGVSVNQPDSCGRTPLYYAAMVGSEPIVEYLISQKADVNRTTAYKGGEGPIHAAARRGHLAVVKLLLSRGADANALSAGSRQMPLGLASQNGHVETVQTLLEHGATVRPGYLLLRNHVDRPEDYRQVFELLIAHGGDVNYQRQDDWAVKGMTPLMCAAAYRNSELVEVLLAHGAEVNVRTEGEKKLSALDFARRVGDRDIEQLLLGAGADDP